MIKAKSFRFKLISSSSLLIMGFISLFSFFMLVYMFYYSLIIRRIYGMDENILSPILSIMIVLFVILFVIALVSSLVCGLTISHRYLKKVDDLTKDIQNIKQEGIEHRLVIEGDDELSHLGQEFNDVLDQLERSMQQQKQFVSDASHELKTPLAIIKGNIDMLQRWGQNDPQVLSSSLEVTKKEVERLITLCHELLHLTREIEIDANDKVDGIEVIEKTIAEFELMNDHIHFTFVHDDHHEIYMKEEHFKQILIILFDNAVKYAKDENDIRIDISLKNNVLKVKDHGIGIPLEKQELIFDRFYKIEESRELNDQSFGLGLAIAKRLLDLYHDYIEVNSVENEYSEFVIYF